jgi:hypothetical protein
VNGELSSAVAYLIFDIENQKVALARVRRGFASQDGIDGFIETIVRNDKFDFNPRLMFHGIFVAAKDFRMHVRPSVFPDFADRHRFDANLV